MSELIKWELVDMELPEECNIILGHSHFIKTVEDLYEALVTASPTLEFGIAFCEAQGLVLWVGRQCGGLDRCHKKCPKDSGHTLSSCYGVTINVLDGQERARGMPRICCHRKPHSVGL